MAFVKEEQVIEMLKKCMDPEIPVDVWNLGLIYNIDLKNSESGNSDVFIKMTLTIPGCAMKNYLMNEVKSKVGEIDEVDNVDVELVFDPRWTPQMMTDEARAKLGMK